MIDPTERFSDRVENYIRYRPHYPVAVLDCLRAECELQASSVIADIGSGTGILAALFLGNGNTVYAVEPNRSMREAGEQFVGHHPHFRSVIGTAESTTLPAGSVDFVTAGQSFHWFDRAKARVEFARILRPQGWVVLLWNERLESSSPFASAYETLLRTYAIDYEKVDHRRIDSAALSEFFMRDFGSRSFATRQRFDFAGLRGRLLSSSYAPNDGHPLHQPMLKELEHLFTAHQTGGEVVIEYETKLFFGRPT